LAAQLILGFLGYAVMKRVGYFQSYVGGAERSAGAYALVCPGTGVFVFGMFFLHTGLVQTGLLERFSLPYFVLLALFVPAQLYAIVTMFRLDGKLLCPARLEATSTGTATA
ncbi:MAG: hypothetical protein HGA45_06290, partial [Chloroflexales bacterium]|nr:hypothetical protein [Chloroflexales bacterium]